MRVLLKIVFIITLIELFVGGGGRVFEIGPTTLRIALFFLNIIIASFLLIYRNKISKHTVLISIVAALALIYYSILGLINGGSISLIIEDVKPLSYIFSIIFFMCYIDSFNRVTLIVSLIKKTSVFVAILYITIQLLFFMGKIDFLSFYNYANTYISPSDFFFRGTSGLFFYKGFIYMVIGLIFWIHSAQSKKKTFSIVIIMTAMIFSGTRGFIVMFGIVYALFYGIPLLLKLNIKILLLSIIFIISSIYFFSNFEIGDKTLSDSIRIQQIFQVFQDINLFSLFTGHGFGIGIPIRPIHMEIAYLEIFHKQGLLGLLLWGAFFKVIYKAYKKAEDFKSIRKPFFLSISFVLLLSITNPVFNNPIGISLFIIALSVFNTLNKLKTYSL